MVNSRQAPVTGSNNFKENNPPDGKNISLPLLMGTFVQYLLS